MLKRLFLVAAITVIATAASAQFVNPLAHPAPDGAIQDFQLTDGRVLVQGNNAYDWWVLTPDNSGSYLNGTWSQIASLPAGYEPYAFSSAVLPDGRVLVVGGEYNFWNFTLTNICCVFDPVANAWSEFNPPPGWGFIGDSPATVLANGTFILGNKVTKMMVSLNPATLTWTNLNGWNKSDFNAEEGWTLMPDGTVLTADVKNAPRAEKYLPNLDMWVTAGNTILDLHSPHVGGPIGYGNGLLYYPPGEIGPAILRPDGTVFQTGSTPTGGTNGHTAIYHPAPNSFGPGYWTVGPDFPSGDDAGDEFASLLPNGKVLVEGNTGYLYEFDGTHLQRGPYAPGSLMVLPTGEVLVNGTGLYVSLGAPSPAWAPAITNCPAALTRGSTYQISGRQFNGLSQANSFGDEFETATNYPLVRIRNNASGHLMYARTHDHSTMAVATGAATVSTYMDIPPSMETGASTLVVVANGIASAPVSVTIN